MPKLVMVAVLAVLLGCAATFAACAGSPSSPVSPSSVSAPPIAEMQALAHGQKVSKAWYTLVPLSQAFKILQGSWSGSNVPGPKTPTWVVIMQGDFGRQNGEHLRWEAAVLNPHGRNQLYTSTRMDTFGAKLTPLPLQ